MIMYMCLYQARRVSGHVYVCKDIDFLCFSDFPTKFWNCYDNGICFLFISKLKLFVILFFFFDNLSLLSSSLSA